MQTKALLIVLGIAGGCVALCVCCGGVGYFGLYRVGSAADRMQSLNDLKQVVLAVHDFHDTNKNMPTKAEDLRRFIRPENDSTMNRLRKGEIEVVWNALPMDQQVDRGRNLVYAWDTKVFAGGVRNVAYLDGVVESIPENQFQQKPKALTQKPGN